MRKVICMLIIIFFLIFCIPFIFVNNYKQIISQKIEYSNEVTINEYNYSEYNTIKLLHQDSSQTEEIPLDTYIANVISAEMPVDFDIEALKAQAVVARTYTIYKIKQGTKHGNADICDKSTCCQAWISKEERLKRWDEDEAQNNWNKILQAVNETIGEIIVYNGEPINAFFHSNSGGKTESPLFVWGGSYPYLQTVETAGEENYTQYSSEVKLTKEELVNKLKEKYDDFTIDFNEENCISIIEIDESNRVKTVKIGNKNISGVEARTLFGLRSANFDVEINNENIKFSVIGYGHGVGMSQTGADAMAKNGYNYIDIIKHFYTNVDILKME